MGIIGRSVHPCHWCGFDGVHVKKNDGKRAYEHCPSCGKMTPAKNGHQENLLLSITRPEGTTPATDDAIKAPGLAKPPGGFAAAPPPPAPPAKPRGFWDQLARKAGDA